MQEKTRLVNMTRFIRYALLISMLSMAMPLVLTSAFGSSVVYAQGSSDNSGQADLEQSWGDKTPPKDYVQSKGPSKSDSAYNWTQMGYASLLMAMMVGFMVWLVRRNRLDT